jgi:hypothetical protein
MKNLNSDSDNTNGNNGSSDPGSGRFFLRRQGIRGMRIGRKAKPSNEQLAEARAEDLQKPLISGEEVRQFLKRQDWIGLNYLRAQRLRGKAGRTPEEAKFLREHDAVEARIQADPKAAHLNASQSISAEAVVLLKLIRSKKLLQKFQYTDGIDRPHEAHDEAERALCDQVTWLVREVCKLARQGRFAPVNTVWHGARAMVETIHEMALLGTVDNLRCMARDSFFLPSLRAKPKTFSHDFDKVAAAIGLSEECVINMDSEALHQMDRPVTRFVAEMIEEIASEKREVERAEETLAMFQRLAKEEPKGEFAKYRGVALEDYWRKQRPFQPEALSYRKLPPLSKSTVPTWWTIAVKPLLDRPETLERIKGTQLYDELCKATDGKDYQIRDELKRRCRPRLASLAKPG